MALKVLKAFRDGGVDYHPGDPAPKGLDPVTLTLLIKARHIYDPKADPRGRGGYVGMAEDGPQARITRQSHAEAGLKVVQNPDFTEQFHGRSAPHTGLDTPPKPDSVGWWGPTPEARAAEVAVQIAEVQRVDAAHRSGEVANQLADLDAQSQADLAGQSKG